MKKIVILCAILPSYVIANVWSNGDSKLKSRLDKINSFYASFTQKIIDSTGTLIQEYHGKMWFRRPNLFKFHIIQPDESILVSDGTSLWIYNPLLKQAIALYLKDISTISNSTPFIFFTFNQLNIWKRYKIRNHGDDFILTPKFYENNLKRFTINLSRNGSIHNFSIVEEDNQSCIYKINFQKNTEINVSNFVFIPPKGITIDDQRKN